MIEDKIIQSRVLSEKRRKAGTLIYQDLLDAYNFFDGKCPYSETPIDDSNWHLEHIIPVSMGGTTDAWNCIPICEACNRSKGSMHLLDWWDKNHTINEEYKLAKLFEYMVGILKFLQKKKQKN